MKRTIVVLVLTAVMIIALAAPAFAVPANNGLGRMFGEHISTEAKAGALGPTLHPGMHRGFRGWMVM